MNKVEQLQKLLEFKKYNKFRFFKPYDYQLKFFKDSKKFKRRFMIAANRCGKSYGAAMEVAYHATGLYPSLKTHSFEWEGHRFIKSELKDGNDKPSPHDLIIWCIGINSDSTRKVMQRELFGTDNGRDVLAMGSGAIPRSCIDFDKIEYNGQRILSARIKHHDPYGNFDGYTTLEFRSCEQGEHAMMGATVDLAWFDEESPHHSEELYAQASARCTTVQGHVMLTFTPENGLTPLIQQARESEVAVIHNVTWDDVPHLSEQTKREILSSFPAWQRDLRSKGLPVIGAGIVYEVDPDSITEDPLPFIPSHWDVLFSYDYSRASDKFVISLLARDPDSGVIHLVEQWINESRSSEEMISIIKSTHYPAAPIINPKDVGNGTTNSQGVPNFSKFLQDAGLNVVGSWYICDSLRTWGVGDKLNLMTSTPMRNNDKFGSVTILGQWKKEGKFKISKTCSNYLREMSIYYWEGKKTSDGNDDHLDSARYGAFSIHANLGKPAYLCGKGNLDNYFGEEFNERLYESY